MCCDRSTPGGHRLESTVHADGLHARCGDTVLVSASTGPSGRYAAVYRGGLDGRNLKRCRRGLRERFDNNIDTHCVDASPDGRFATNSVAIYRRVTYRPSPHPSGMTRSTQLMATRLAERDGGLS